MLDRMCDFMIFGYFTDFIVLHAQVWWWEVPGSRPGKANTEEGVPAPRDKNL
jgi:hypothetical protein